MATFNRSLAPALVLVLTAACSSGTSGDVASDSDATGTPSATKEASDQPQLDPEDAERVLAKVVADLRADPATYFKMDASAAGVLMRAQGVDGDGEWIATYEFITPERPLFMSVRSIGQNLWMQMKDWQEPATGCWLELEPGQVPVGVLALQARETSYLALTDSLATTGFDGPSGKILDGTLSLEAASELFTGQVLADIDFDDVSGRDVEEAVVPVRIEVDDRLRRVSLEGADLASSIESIGGSLGPDAQLALADWSVQVEYGVPGPEFDGVEAPEQDLVYGAPEKGCR